MGLARGSLPPVGLRGCPVGHHGWCNPGLGCHKRVPLVSSTCLSWSPFSTQFLAVCGETPPRLDPQQRGVAGATHSGARASLASGEGSPAVSFCLTAVSTERQGAWIATPSDAGPPHPVLPYAGLLLGRSLPAPTLPVALNPLPPTPLLSSPRDHPPDPPVWRPGEVPTLCLVGVRRERDRVASDTARWPPPPRAGAMQSGHGGREEIPNARPKRLLLNGPATDGAAPGG